MRPLTDWIGAALAALILIFFVLFFTDRPASAGEILERDAVHAILGEARGEGFIGMYAVACAIRNRGHLRGVDGLRADISDASGALYHLAGKAWAQSEYDTDITNGGDHWYAHNIMRPWWARYGTRTAVIGGHTYMKNVKKK